MINVSNEFLQLMGKRRNFMGYAEVTFADGTTLTLTEDDFTVNNNSISDAAGASGIPLGVAVCKTIQIEIANPNDKYSEYDFFGAKILYKLRYRLSKTVESFNIGEFTVLDPYTYGETIIITAMDNMYKANEYYYTNMLFPTTIGNILADICSTFDIPLGTTSFANDDFVIETRPDGNYIVRNLIGYIAMIAGGNARINRNGYLEIVSYDFSVMDVVLSGGTFKPWTEGDTVSGGTLNPWTEGENLSGGELSERPYYHVFRKFKNLKIDTDNVLITGIQMKLSNEDGTTTTLLKGAEGYVLEVENPLVTGKESEALELIGNALIGGQMRKFEGDHLAYPLAEFMDPCIVIDRKGNSYPTILTDIDFTFFGFTSIKNSAESPEHSKIKYTPGYTKAIYEAQKLVEKERTDRELAVEQLNKTLSSASGMYSTDVEQADGSFIRYFHDKKTLGESQNIIKITSDAIGFSQDGGTTYPYGITLNGETVTRILYAEGINADYIDTGAIRVGDSEGNTIFYCNFDTGELLISATNFTLDSDGRASMKDLSVEGEVSTEVLNVSTINNGEYQKTLITNPTIYVNANTGDDDQKCVNGAVFQTLQGAIDSIPKFMNGRTVYIELQTDTTENVNLQYFSSGRIYIYLAGKTIYGYVQCYLSQYVNLYGGTKSGGGTDITGAVHPSTGLSSISYTASIIYKSSCGFIYNLQVYGSDNLISGTTGRVGIHGVDFGKVYISAIDFVNVYQGVRTNSGANIYVNTSSGMASDYAFSATSGSEISLASLAQAGGTKGNTWVGNGAEIRYHNPTFETGNASTSSNTASTTKVSKNVTYTSSKGNAIQYYGSSSAKWRSDNTPKVGTWGYGNHVAFWFFGDKFENVANKDVTKIEITFTRNSGGYGSAVAHNFYAHNYETQPSTVSPSYYGTGIGSASVATGKSATITITNKTLIAAIISRKGICSIPPSQSNAYYSVMSGTMKVKFYYTE